VMSRHSVRTAPRPDIGLESRVCVPIRCQGALFGYLWLIDADESLTEADCDAAERCAAEIGTAMYRRDELEKPQRELELRLLESLLGPDAADRSGPSPASGSARADASVSARAGGDERAPGNGAGAARADASRAGGDQRTPGNGAGSGPADGYDPVDPSRRQGAAGAGGRQNEPDTSGRQSGSSRADADKYAISGTNGRQYDSDRAELIAAWLDGWVGAACEQRPELAEEGAPYLRRRLAATAAGELCVTVHHSDLYAKFE